MKKYNPLVSVIIPSYNSANFIASTLESVIFQTYEKLEIIVIDDGSTDDTAEIVKKYEIKDKRIKYFYQDNQKLSKARNTGIKNSLGHLIAFLDADDIWLPSKIEVSVPYFMDDCIDVIYTSFYYFSKDEDIITLEKLFLRTIKEEIHYGSKGIENFVGGNYIQVPTTLVRKSSLLSVGMFTESDRKGAEDYELWLKMLENGFTIRGVNEPLSLYRLHSDSMSAKDLNVTHGVLEVLFDFFKRNSDMKNKFDRAIKNWIFFAIIKSNNFHEVEKSINFWQFYKSKYINKYYTYIYILPISFSMKKYIHSQLFIRFQLFN